MPFFNGFRQFQSQIIQNILSDHWPHTGTAFINFLYAGKAVIFSGICLYLLVHIRICFQICFQVRTVIVNQISKIQDNSVCNCLLRSTGIGAGIRPCIMPEIWIVSISNDQIELLLILPCRGMLKFDCNTCIFLPHLRNFCVSQTVKVC